MAAKTYLLDPQGRIVKRPQWEALKKSNQAAWVHAQYENDRFRIVFRAFDRYHSNGVVPFEHWMRFVVITENIIRDDIEGNPLKEPKYVEDPDASGQYRTFEEAQGAYRLFLARYTDSSFDAETGSFHEVGNKLNPDIPKPVVDSPKASAEDFGSW